MGRPGCARSGGPGRSGSDAEVDAANNAELVRRLAGAPASSRLARYRCVLFYLPSYGAVPTICQGDCTGRILEAAARDAGFGYDPYFFSDELGKTLRRGHGRGEGLGEPPGQGAQSVGTDAEEPKVRGER